MNRLLMFQLAHSCAAQLAGAARADPCWIMYEGDDFPENVVFSGPAPIK